MEQTKDSRQYFMFAVFSIFHDPLGPEWKVAQFGLIEEL